MRRWRNARLMIEAMVAAAITAKWIGRTDIATERAQAPLLSARKDQTMQVEVTKIEALEDRAQYAERRLRHCKQWYAERLERLTAYAKENGIWHDVACIIANGSLSDGNRYDPPTYAQQMNTAIHRAEAAEERASKLQGEVDTLEAQIAELRIGWWNDMRQRGVSQDDALAKIKSALVATTPAQTTEAE